jgi:hypothetical protein
VPPCFDLEYGVRSISTPREKFNVVVPVLVNTFPTQLSLEGLRAPRLGVTTSTGSTVKVIQSSRKESQNCDSKRLDDWISGISGIRTNTLLRSQKLQSITYCTHIEYHISCRSTGYEVRVLVTCMEMFAMIL